MAAETSTARGASGMLLLNGLPAHTQVSVDAHDEVFVTNEQFAGIKSLPPGWHCVSWSISTAPERGVDHSIGGVEGSVRNVMLRWFEQDEIVVRQLDRFHQRLVDPSQSTSQTPTRNRRSRLTRKLDPSQSQRTIVTPDVLNSIEPRLLPLPSSAEKLWRSATRHLHRAGGVTGRKVIAKVLGVDSSTGDSVTDSLATGPSRAKDRDEQDSLQLTGNQGRQENGKIIWGKSRPPVETDSLEAFEVDVDGEDDRHSGLTAAAGGDKKRKRPTPADQTEVDDIDDDVESLLFTLFDLRRSWPPNSVGADLTRWSHDKSWLLQDVAQRSRLGATTTSEESPWYLALLCEFELAFILFLLANNSYAYEQWKELITLFCRSSSILGAESPFRLHPSTTLTPTSSASSTSADLAAHTAFVRTLHGQLSLLSSDFWTSQSSRSEEQTLLSELDVLRGNIARSLSPQLAGQHQSLVEAWRALSHTSTAKFGWLLDNRLDEEAEVQDDLDADQGEDAPAVVQL